MQGDQMVIAPVSMYRTKFKRVKLEILVAPGTKSIIDTCLICRDDLDRREKDSAFIECLHWFHYKCIAAWFELNKNECPECRHRTDHICRVSDPLPKHKD